MRLRNGKVLVSYNDRNNIPNGWNNDITVLTDYVKNKGGTIKCYDLIIAIREGGCLNKLLLDPYKAIGRTVHCKRLRKSGEYLVINE